MTTTGGGLPPLESDQTRKETGVGASMPPVIGAAGLAPSNDGGAADVGQFTHESKLPPLRLEEPRSRIAKTPTIVAISSLIAVVVLATAVSFFRSAPSQKAPESQPEQASVTHAVQVPDVIANRPSISKPDAGVDAQSDSLRRGGAGGGSQLSEASQAAIQAADAFRQTRREALREEREKALSASLYANMDDPFAAEQRGTLVASGSNAASSFDAMGAQHATSAGGSAAQTVDQNLQSRKNDFLTQTDRSDGYLVNHLVRPRSPYEVKAGTIIPAVLITGINSDLPGTVLGQVRENVYDTVTGNYLLIPQGSKLFANYDSMVSYGQERVLVCWQRLIRPDGGSLSLDCQPGVDLGGNAGFADQVDNHWWRVITGIALGSVLAAGVVAPQGNVTGFVPTIGQGMAGNAAGAVNQAGQQITNRALNIQPTIKIRPGFSVNVLVTKDLVLDPYQVGER